MIPSRIHQAISGPGLADCIRLPCFLEFCAAEHSNKNIKTTRVLQGPQPLSCFVMSCGFQYCFGGRRKTGGASCSTTQSWIKGTNRYDNRPWEAKVKKGIKKVSTRFDSPRISERSLASRSRQLEWNGKNATICRVGIITNCIKTTFFGHCYKMCNAIVIPAGTAPSLWVSSFLCIFRHFSSFLIIYHISDQSRFWPRTGHCN